MTNQSESNPENQEPKESAANDKNSLYYDHGYINPIEAMRNAPQNPVPQSGSADSPAKRKKTEIKAIHIYNFITMLLSFYLASVDSGFSIGAFFIWLIFFWVLSIPFRIFGWFGSFLNSRPCPVCGLRIKNGKTSCDSCGTDFLIR